VTGQVLKIIALRPDAVMTGGAGTPGALPFLALQERGYKGGVYGQHGLVNADFVRVVGAAGQRQLRAHRPGDRRRAAAGQLPDQEGRRQTSAPCTRRSTTQPTTDAFSAYSFDGWLVFADAAQRALSRRPSRERPSSAWRCATPSSAPRKWWARTASTTSSRAAIYGVDEARPRDREAREQPVEARA
jgi:ABC-type branched-subunit amino acid transport system substrate-binding protein